MESNQPQFVEYLGVSSHEIMWAKEKVLFYDPVFDTVKTCTFLHVLWEQKER